MSDMTPETSNNNFQAKVFAGETAQAAELLQSVTALQILAAQAATEHLHE